MNFIHQIERIQKLNKLIEQETTGTPDELASTLGVSRSKLYELIDGLKSLGKKVKYKRVINSFYYEDHTKLDIQFSFKLIKQSELEKITGGLKYSLPYFFLDGRNLASLYRRR